MSDDCPLPVLRNYPATASLASTPSAASSSPGASPPISPMPHGPSLPLCSGRQADLQKEQRSKLVTLRTDVMRRDAT